MYSICIYATLFNVHSVQNTTQLMHIDLSLLTRIFIGKILNETLSRTIYYSNIGSVLFCLETTMLLYVAIYQYSLCMFVCL